VRIRALLAHPAGTRWTRQDPVRDANAVLVDRFPGVELVICAGAAGALDPALSVEDLVGTASVEHDFRLLFATRPLPRFAGDAAAIERLRRAVLEISGFKVLFDVIASGDEDVVSAERAAAIRAQTGAACVAWEGSGSARAAAFNGIRSVELRAVTDAADMEAPQDFAAQSRSPCTTWRSYSHRSSRSPADGLAAHSRKPPPSEASCAEGGGVMASTHVATIRSGLGGGLQQPLQESLAP
jgi:phosphorylase superfamily protein